MGQPAAVLVSPSVGGKSAKLLAGIVSTQRGGDRFRKRVMMIIETAEALAAIPDDAEIAEGPMKTWETVLNSMQATTLLLEG
ncbi:MAG: hypothetical protein ABI193_01900, partial [Minicystis sp.]